MVTNQIQFIVRSIVIFSLFLPVMILPRKLTKLEKKALKEFSNQIAERKIKYSQLYLPADEKNSLKMDCSNTVKYTYRKLFHLDLPRTSYEQYKFVKNNGTFSTTPVGPEGKIDSGLLNKKLKSGDILFWTNTHNDIPAGWDPPISHVMIYLGKSKTGKQLMFGAGTFGVGKNTKNGGIDIYPFDPEMRLGCVKNKKKECIRNSEFFGFGKPAME